MIAQCRALTRDSPESRAAAARVRRPGPGAAGCMANAMLDIASARKLSDGVQCNPVLDLITSRPSQDSDLARRGPGRQACLNSDVLLVISGLPVAEARHVGAA
jgi:hypothetical protein